MLNAGIAMPVPASWPVSCVVLRCFGSISLVIMYSKGLGKPLHFHKEKLLNQLVMVVLPDSIKSVPPVNQGL